MAKSSEELNFLSQKLINNSLDKHLINDLSKHQSAQDGSKKTEAFNRMLLLLGSGNASVNGWKYGTDNLEQTNTQFKDTNLPIGVLLSGHIGRTYMNFGNGEKSQEVLNWLTSGDESSNKGIHNAPNPFGDNLENNLTGAEIAFLRTATHSAKKDTKTIKELKGMRYGTTGMLSSAVDYRNLSPLNLIKGAAALSFAALYTPIFMIGAGLNILNTKNRDETLKDIAKPFGLFASWAKDFSKFVIGLVTLPLYEVVCILNLKKLFTKPESYFKAMTKPFRPSINYEHFGFNVGMGGKEANGQNGHVYINHVKDKGIIGMGLEGTAPKTHGELGAHSLVGAADRFTPLEGEKTDKDELKNAIKAIGLEVASKDGKEYMLTSLGMQMAKSCICPYTYNGVQINNHPNVDTVLLTKTPPKEIAYFKAAASYGDFMKQEPIFKDIDKKPLLRDNPTLSLNACVYLGALYANNDKPRLAQFENLTNIVDIESKVDKNNLIFKTYQASNLEEAQTKLVKEKDDSVLHSSSKTKLDFTEQTRKFVDDLDFNPTTSYIKNILAEPRKESEHMKGG